MSSPKYSDNSPCKSNEPVPSTSKIAKDDEAKNKRKAMITKLFPSSSLRENSENDRQPSTSNASPSKSKVNEMTICGVDLVLPVKPYKCQVAVISKVIKAIKESKNCLVESPTGTGKTLALLCATLAWQQQEKKRLIKQKDDDAVLRNPDLNKTLNSSATNMASPQKTITEPEIQFVKPIHGKKSIYDVPIEECSFSYAEKPKKLFHDLNESDGLVNITKKIRLSEASSFYPDMPHEAKKLDQNTDKDFAQDNIYIQKLLNNHQEQISMIIDCSLPVIYYGARTHKQLEQVVQEFKRTEYAKASPMTILSSRDFSCIKTFDKTVWASKNDMCRSCTKSSSPGTKNELNCLYYSNYKALKHSTLPPVFDLKQLISEGRRIDACPYYAARKMGTVAQIIFCPYNYLIEPAIRKSMQINLENNIVIIDEGHNIEDVCRESASCTFSQNEIEHALKELNTASTFRFANKDVLDYISYLHMVLQEWSSWFLNQKPLIEKQPVNDSTAEYVWEVKNFVETLDNHNIGQKNYPDFSNNAKIFCKKLRDDPRMLVGINQATGSLIEDLDTVFGYLFRNSGRCIDDYKPVMVRKLRSEFTGRSKLNFKVDQTECLSLSMECLNPGVVFADLRAARCVLLASGTLTPMYSLPSELETAFPYDVSPKHVLEDDRVWVGSLGGRKLQCDSEATRSPEVQDELGLVLLHVCEITPHGVLCFLPSYRLMKILYQRWRSTKLWEKLQIIKDVFTEGRTMEDHEITMNRYNKCVGNARGALLLAVYRGKVAEGMDFKDHQARAVIAVGVPYPSQNTAIKEKMKYNDKYSKDRNLLTGREWLKVQAYRALNQAAGRVVRHAWDWGAVLLVDRRYSEQEYCTRLATWLKERLGNNHNDHSTFFRGDNSLKAFMTRMKNEE